MTRDELDAFLDADLEDARALEARVDDPELGQLARELGELRGPVTRALESAPEWSPIREGRLVGQVLSKTTRQDLSWRGDVHVLGRFVRERLLQSPALRAVAALLLLQLLAFPLVLSEAVQTRVVRLFFDRPVELDLDPAELPVASRAPQEAELPAPETDPLDGLDPTRFENARRRARFALSTVAAPRATDGLAGDALEIRLLGARSRLLRDAHWTPMLEDPLPAGASLPARVLQAEVHLDRLVLRGQRGAVLGAVLNDLALALEEGEGGPDARASLELARGVLDRARAYGAWEAPADFRPEAVELPLAAAWRARLARAAASLGSHPTLSAWTAAD